MLGATREDLANVFGVSAPTIDYWRKTRPEFAQALADGRVLADANVARSCYQRAIGAVTPETKVYFSKDGEVITHDLQKHHAPDAASIEFWLTNRQPDLWKRSRSQDSAPNAPVQIEIIGGPQSAQQTFIASPQSDGRSRIRDAGDDADLALRTDEGTEKLPPPGGA
jgi:hypothetical protein